MSNLIQEYVCKILPSSDTPWLFGGSWNGVPIDHNILRSDYWIYTEEYEADHRVHNTYLKFIKVKKLPTQQDSLLLEWKTIDLLNHLSLSTTSEEDAMTNLVSALQASTLNRATLLEISNNYGSAETNKLVLQAVKQYDVFMKYVNRK